MIHSVISEIHRVITRRCKNKILFIRTIIASFVKYFYFQFPFSSNDWIYFTAYNHFTIVFLYIPHTKKWNQLMLLLILRHDLRENRFRKMTGIRIFLSVERPFFEKLVPLESKNISHIDHEALWRYVKVGIGTALRKSLAVSLYDLYGK